jgi:hypothetical protein
MRRCSTARAPRRAALCARSCPICCSSAWVSSRISSIDSSPGCAADTDGVAVVQACPPLRHAGGAAPLAQCRVRIPPYRQIPERHDTHRLPPVDHGHAANGMRAHEPHRLLNALCGGDGDYGMTTDVGQGGGRRVLRLGHRPHHDIPVRRRTALTDMVPHAAPRLPADPAGCALRSLHGRQCGQRKSVSGGLQSHERLSRLCPSLGKCLQLPRSARLLSPLRVSPVPHFSYASADAACSAVIGPAGGNMRYDAITSISCINKAFQALVMRLSF